MRITGVNHLTFAVADLQQSIFFYEQALRAELRYRDERTAYFDLNGIWLALNIQTDLPRPAVPPSYTHIAFTVEMKDIDDWEQHLHGLGVNIVPGWARDEGKGQSVYFTDPDGHLLELHTGNLDQRLWAYQADAGTAMLETTQP